MTVRNSSRTRLHSDLAAARTSEVGKSSNGTGAHKSTTGEGSPTLLPTAASDASRPGWFEPRRCGMLPEMINRETAVSGPYRNRLPLKQAIDPADL